MIASLIIVGSGSAFKEQGATTTFIQDNDPLTNTEIDTGGLFNTGVDFTRFFSLLFFGIGLPNDTPLFFTSIFALWSSLFSIFTVGFIISSIWNG